MNTLKHFSLLPLLCFCITSCGDLKKDENFLENMKTCIGHGSIAMNQRHLGSKKFNEKFSIMDSEDDYVLIKGESTFDCQISKDGFTYSSGGLAGGRSRQGQWAEKKCKFSMGCRLLGNKLWIIDSLIIEDRTASKEQIQLANQRVLYNYLSDNNLPSKSAPEQEKIIQRMENGLYYCRIPDSHEISDFRVFINCSDIESPKELGTDLTSLVLNSSPSKPFNLAEIEKRMSIIKDRKSIYAEGVDLTLIASFEGIDYAICEIQTSILLESCETTQMKRFREKNKDLNQ